MQAGQSDQGLCPAERSGDGKLLQCLVSLPAEGFAAIARRVKSRPHHKINRKINMIPQGLLPLKSNKQHGIEKHQYEK
jgi:hypothetical protein